MQSCTVQCLGINPGGDAYMFCGTTSSDTAYHYIRRNLQRLQAVALIAISFVMDCCALVYGHVQRTSLHFRSMEPDKTLEVFQGWCDAVLHWQILTITKDWGLRSQKNSICLCEMGIGCKERTGGGNRNLSFRTTIDSRLLRLSFYPLLHGLRSFIQLKSDAVSLLHAQCKQVRCRFSASLLNRYTALRREEMLYNLLLVSM